MIKDEKCWNCKSDICTTWGKCNRCGMSFVKPTELVKDLKAAVSVTKVGEMMVAHVEASDKVESLGGKV